MTTAHRATWKPARGGAGEDGSFALHAPTAAAAIRDAPAHGTLKLRRPSAALRDADVLREELLRSEHAHKRARAVASALNLDGVLAPGGVAVEGGGDGRDEDAVLDASDAESDDDGGGGGSWRLKKEAGGVDGGGLEAESDDPGGGAGRVVNGTKRDVDNTEEEEEDDDDDDEDEDDEDEALYAELAKIRAERAAENAAAESLKAVAGNPLLGNIADGLSGDGDDESTAGQPPAVSFGVKRRWDDDVVFRNQSKREPKPEVRFINDTTRNDFHRRFLRRFVRS
jgi:protein CWC15